MSPATTCYFCVVFRALACSEERRRAASSRLAATLCTFLHNGAGALLPPLLSCDALQQHVNRYLTLFRDHSHVIKAAVKGFLTRLLYCVFTGITLDIVLKSTDLLFCAPRSDWLQSGGKMLLLLSIVYR